MSVCVRWPSSCHDCTSLSGSAKNTSSISLCCLAIWNANASPKECRIFTRTCFAYDVKKKSARCNGGAGDKRIRFTQTRKIKRTRGNFFFYSKDCVILFSFFFSSPISFPLAFYLCSFTFRKIRLLRVHWHDRRVQRTKKRVFNGMNRNYGSRKNTNK